MVESGEQLVRFIQCFIFIAVLEEKVVIARLCHQCLHEVLINDLRNGLLCIPGQSQCWIFFVVAVFFTHSTHLK